MRRQFLHFGITPIQSAACSSFQAFELLQQSKTAILSWECWWMFDGGIQSPVECPTLAMPIIQGSPAMCFASSLKCQAQPNHTRNHKKLKNMSCVRSYLSPFRNPPAHEAPLSRPRHWRSRPMACNHLGHRGPRGRSTFRASSSSGFVPRLLTSRRITLHCICGRMSSSRDRPLKKQSLEGTAVYRADL